eukprot:m.128200 g.128200  ORF g.128200 m.128200 type:complete len:230 (+) comp37945_c0_seq13:306-995(+)
MAFRCTYPDCERVFPKKWKLEEHECLHTGERRFACDYPNCSKTYIRSAHLRRHRLSHTGVKPFSCSFPGCSSAFSTKYNLKKHQAVHEKPKPYKCDYPGCEECFSKSSQLRNHSLICHSGISSPFKCTHDSCEEAFALPHQLAKHEKKHERAYVCNIESCALTFPNWTFLCKHTKQCHPKNFKCSVCGLQVSTGSNVRIEICIEQLVTFFSSILTCQLINQTGSCLCVG